MKTLSLFCVVCYLLAIILANGVVTVFGQAALPFTAFVLIPFDLLARDILHESWKGKFLWVRMSLLIVSGSILSYVSTIASAEIAFASAVSFLCCGVTNAAVYFILDLFKCRRVVRMNGSNFFAAIVDSVVFPMLAFSVVVPSLSIAQASSKFLGGFVWTALFLWSIKRRASNASSNPKD